MEFKDGLHSENIDEITLMENSYRTIHKLIKSGMWKMYCDRNFQIVSVEWSDELRRMVGYNDVNDFPDIFESWSDLLHPDDYDRIMDEIDPVLRDVTGNTIFNQEYRLNTRDRGYRWFRATGDVSRRTDGTPYCFFGVFLDITDQKEHAELEKARDEALKKANAALAAMNALHETMGSGAWSNSFDREGKSCAVEWSDAFRALLGFENEQDFPNDEDFFFARVHPDDKKYMDDAYRRTITDTTGKEIYDIEIRVMTKSGEYRWFRTTGRMTRREDGSSDIFYGMFMDIDDKKKTDAALVWRDTLSDIMTQNLDSVYFVMNKKNRDSVYVSPSIEHIFGIPKDTPHPLLALQKLERDAENDFSVKDLKDLPEGESIVLDCWITPVGSTVAKMFQKTVYHVVKGNEDLLIFELADHTHEQEIRKNIEDALEIARNANAAKSSFLSNMSHDIRTPMNVIVGLTNLMEHELDNPEKLQGYLQKMKTSSKHLLGLINDILDMSKIESGKTMLNVEKFNLREQIKEIDTLIRQQTNQHQQKLEIYADKLCHENVEGDALRIRQVFINILGNAVKYTQDGGTIRFSVSEIECNSESCAKYKFVVTDNGMGMKPEYVEHIFEPFTRQENSITNRIQGTGLGMAIAKNIVDMMGGIIRVDSKEGEGSTFEVILELRIDKNAETEKQSVSADEVGNSEEEQILRGMHFLCAEDNELNAEILQALLEMAGASCEIYPNGKAVVEKAAQLQAGEYDAILMDIQMPVMNGYEAARAIRAAENPVCKNIPIIAMTANAFSDDIQRSLDAGMNAHISKPMELTVLERVIRTQYKG